MNNNLFVYSGDCRLCEVGLETELVDINGQQLHTGDVVVVFTEDYTPKEATVVVSNQYQTYRVFEHGSEKTVHRKSNVHKPFIRGLAGVDWSNSENRWGVLCIKKYTELIEGERWSIFNIRSCRDGSEVEVEVPGDE
jgi:ASC-1-like (ASCH) protein